MRTEDATGVYSPKYTELILMRHAETEWNRRKLIQGHLDSPLTPLGEQMAFEWAQVLKSLEATEGPFTRIISSDLGRAVKTAQLINKTLMLHHAIEPGVKEMNWGEWSGGIYKEIRKASKQAVRKQVHLCWKFQPPGGESRIDVLHRTLDSLMEIAEKCLIDSKTSTKIDTNTTTTTNNIDTDTPPIGNSVEKILVVTHGGVIRCLINYFLNRSFMWDEPDIMKPYHLHRFLYNHDAMVIILKQENALALPTGISAPTLE